MSSEYDSIRDVSSDKSLDYGSGGEDVADFGGPLALEDGYDLNNGRQNDLGADTNETQHDNGGAVSNKNLFPYTYEGEGYPDSYSPRGETVEETEPASGGLEGVQQSSADPYTSWPGLLDDTTDDT